MSKCMGGGSDPHRAINKIRPYDAIFEKNVRSGFEDLTESLQICENLQISEAESLKIYTQTFQQRHERSQKFSEISIRNDSSSKWSWA